MFGESPLFLVVKMDLNKGASRVGVFGEEASGVEDMDDEVGHDRGGNLKQRSDDERREVGRRRSKSKEAATSIWDIGGCWCVVKRPVILIYGETVGCLFG